MAADDAVARHDLVGHPEVTAAVRDELVRLFERAGVEQQVDALARGELAGVVLLAYPVSAAAQFRETLELGETILR